MQKIVFIVQEYMNPFEPRFEYLWNYYGVYSADLSNELGISQFFNILEEHPVDDNGYQSYAIIVVDETDTTDLMEDKKLGVLAEYLNKKEPRLLEVISSIIFFRQEGYQDEERKKLVALKGHLSDFFEKAYFSLNEIEEIVNGSFVR